MLVVSALGMVAKDAVNSDARLGCIAGPVSEKPPPL